MADTNAQNLTPDEVAGIADVVAKVKAFITAAGAPKGPAREIDNRAALALYRVGATFGDNGARDAGAVILAGVAKFGWSWCDREFDSAKTEIPAWIQDVLKLQPVAGPNGVTYMPIGAPTDPATGITFSAEQIWKFKDDAEVLANVKLWISGGLPVAVIASRLGISVPPAHVVTPAPSTDGGQTPHGGGPGTVSGPAS